MKLKLETITVKVGKHMLNPLGREKFKGFVINRSETTMTVLKPTDDSFEYFHLINVVLGHKVVPLTDAISRIELSDEFDFS